MGCVSAKHDINDIHPNIFQVHNVNEQGELVSPGRLEINESELILHQKEKPPTIWPLRSLRKYGFDSEIFSFECGRRCPTGEGIYAFHCRKAEQLFNVVQRNISRNITDDTHNLISATVSELANSTGGAPLVQRWVLNQQPDGYLTPLTAPSSVRTHPSLSRPGSITSNGPTSPPALTPPAETPLEHNNNKRGSLVPDHSYTNSSIINAFAESKETQANYQNVGLSSPNTLKSFDENYVQENSHLYMNVDTKEMSPIATNITKDFEIFDEGNAHCYANIDAKDLEQLRLITKPADLKEVQYAKLDFNPTQSDGTSAQNGPESPNRIKSGYVEIDFDKTNALSQTVNPTNKIDEGYRKTRHNSSISEVIT